MRLGPSPLVSAGFGGAVTKDHGTLKESATGDGPGALQPGSEAATGRDSPWQTPAVIWFIAVIDLAAGAYLLAHAQRQDKHGMLAVGATLIVCSALLGGLGTWQARQQPAQPVAPGAPDLPARTV